MKVLITGGGGFLGTKLARALVSKGSLRGREISALVLADLVAPAPMEAPFPVECRACDITNRDHVSALMAVRPDVIYHLAAVVSAHAEAEFDTGMAVNLMGSLNVFEAARAIATCPVVVFASSLAVYGGDLPDPVPDWVMLNPQTSYGTQKAAAELLLSDFSRKGYLDGRGLRLPTITIRPGKPNKAASSFMSSIFREPLQGQEAECPVPPEFAHWYLSPRRCVENLIHGAEVEAAALGDQCCFVLPGRTHTIAEMVAAMERVAGPGPARLIRWGDDPAVQNIVYGWKARFDPAKALALGFKADAGFEDNVRFFLEDDIARA